MTHLKSYIDSYGWMAELKEMRRFYLASWTFYHGWTIFVFFIPFIYALGMVAAGTNLLIDTPGGLVEIDTQHAGDIQSLTTTFNSFIFTVAYTIPVMVLAAMFFPVMSDWLVAHGKSIDAVIEYRRPILLSEAASYLSQNPSEMPKNGNIVEWIDLQLADKEKSGFWKHFESQIPQMLDDMSSNRHEIVEWIGPIAFMMAIVLIVITTLIWSSL